MVMGGLISTDLFPTKTSLFIFISYMGLFINQGLLVTATKNSSNSYNYNVTTVVLFTEFFKLIVSIFILLKDKTVTEAISECLKFRKVLYLYMIPAFLYCLYNNLAFVNLAAFDPTTYFLLLQFRVVVTGIIYQFLFNRKLSTKQWFSLILLTIGCIIKQLNIMEGSSAATPASSTDSYSSFFSSRMTFNILLLLVQVMCSCLAGVYNEYLLKGVGSETHIMVQNLYMYLDSIICNIVVLMLTGNFLSAFTINSMSSVFKPKIILIIMNNAGIGIITSLFLKYLNSILKTFASALELMFTAILSWIIFGIAINAYTVAAIFIVSGASFIYSQNPVVNKPNSVDDSNRIEEVESKKNLETV